MALQKEFKSIEEMFKYIESESYSSILGIYLYKAGDLSIGESLVEKMIELIGKKRVTFLPKDVVC